MQFLKSSLLIFIVFLISGCKEQPKTDTKTTYNQVESVAKKAKLPAFKTNKQFNDYWYSGQAEITSYQLEQ
ncbi:MAG: hypothetical protein WBC43_10310, partial [Olleya sp.]